MKPLILFLLGGAVAVAQPFSAGIKAGVPLNDFVSTAQIIQSNNYNIFKSNINRYLFGATAELHLPFHLSIELDAIYRHLNYQQNAGSTGVTTVNSVSRTTAGAWEFPLLAKYRFGDKSFHPFIDAGVAWDTLSGLKQDVTAIVSSITKTSSTSSPTELTHSTTRGYVLGAGLDFKFLVLHIQPEVRFTRWGAKHFLDPAGLLHSNMNQGEFILGLNF